MGDPVGQEAIAILLREADCEVERQKALLARLEAGADDCILTEARELLRALEEQRASYRCSLANRDRATG